MTLTWRFATSEDLGSLAQWNHQLIRDEGHRNPMTVTELAQRMSGWLEREYQAVIFCVHGDPIGYALYRADPVSVYLRQFYIHADRRRQGFGRAGMRILREEIWPKSVRLTVDVLCQNQSGIAFWRSVGYRDYCLTLEMMPGASGV